MSRAPLDRLFRPKSVALIGASTDPGKIGGRPLHFLVKHGFAGAIWPVNPNADAIEGIDCYPDIQSLPGPPDVAHPCASGRSGYWRENLGVPRARVTGRWSESDPTRPGPCSVH